MTGTAPVAASDARTRSPNAPPVCASSVSSSRTAASSARRCSAHAASSSPSGSTGRAAGTLAARSGTCSVSACASERRRSRRAACRCASPRTAASRSSRALRCPCRACAIAFSRSRSCASTAPYSHFNARASFSACRGKHEDALHEDVAGSDGSAHGRRIIPLSRRRRERNVSKTRARKPPWPGRGMRRPLAAVRHPSFPLRTGQGCGSAGAPAGAGRRRRRPHASARLMHLNLAVDALVCVLVRPLASATMKPRARADAVPDPAPATCRVRVPVCAGVPCPRWSSSPIPISRNRARTRACSPRSPGCRTSRCAIWKRSTPTRASTPPPSRLPRCGEPHRVPVSALLVLDAADAEGVAGRGVRRRIRVRAGRHALARQVSAAGADGGRRAGEIPARRPQPARDRRSPAAARDRRALRRHDDAAATRAVPRAQRRGHSGPADVDTRIEAFARRYRDLLATPAAIAAGAHA